MTLDPNRRTKWIVTDQYGHVYGSDNPQGTRTATQAEILAYARQVGATQVEAVRYDIRINVTKEN